MLIFEHSNIAAWYVFFSCYLLFSLFVFFCQSKALDLCGFFVLIISVTLFYGLRTNGSPDTYMYVNRFINLGTLEQFEWSFPFFYLMKTISFVGEDAVTYKVLSSFFFVLILSFYIFIAFDKCNKTLCLTLCSINWSIYDMVTNTYRQGVAGVLVLLATALFIKRRYYLSSFLFLLSIGFHWSSVLIVFLFFVSVLISKSSFKLQQLIGMFLLLYFIVSMFNEMGLATILGKMDSMFSYIGDITGYNIVNKQNSYLNDGVVGALFYNYSFVKKLYSVVDFIIPLGISLYVILRGAEHSNERNSLFYSFFLMLSLYFVFLIDMTWFFRNMYWAVIFGPAICTYFIAGKFPVNSQGTKLIIGYRSIYFMVLFFCFFVFSTSITLWRSEILRLNFLVNY